MGTAAVRNALARGGTNPSPVIIVDESGRRATNQVGSTNANLGVTIRSGSTEVVVGATSGNATATGYLNVLATGVNNSGNAAALVTSNGGDGVNGSTVLATTHWALSGATFDRVRTPNTFKPLSVSVVSVNTAVAWWTPTSGKRFRMMGYNLTSSKAASIQFRDGSVATFYASGAQVANTPGAPVIIGNGYLSASANNVLNLDVDTAVPVTITGTIWGTEE